jgi:hypothetical protein
VSLSGAGSACVTQPVEFTVRVENPPADGKVALSVDGKELAAGTLANGVYRATLPGSSTPGRTRSGRSPAVRARPAWSR